jgi:hypothetical protein
MSNVDINLDSDALAEYIANLPVVEGGLTYGQLAEQEAARQEAAGAGSVQVTPRDTTRPVVPPEDSGETLFMPRIREDTGTEESDEDRRARLDREESARQFDADRQAAAALAEQRRVDAFARLRSLLNRYDLGALEGNVRDLIARGITDGNAVLFELRETESFKTRFKANAKRAAAGLPELDPATYIGLEQSYRNVLASNNLPIGFYDDPDDFNAFIEGAVSPGELQSRISDGYRKVQDADPEVKRQMQELYGVAEPELLAYFLDPKRARPLLDSAALRRQADAAAIAARGREQGGLDLTRESAEALAARGITPEEAATQFAQRGALAGLYNPLTGEEGLTQEEELGATFGFDPVAAQKLERRRAQRRAEFQGGGSFARTTGATSGTVETGIGTAT